MLGLSSRAWSVRAVAVGVGRSSQNARKAGNSSGLVHAGVNSQAAGGQAVLLAGPHRAEVAGAEEGEHVPIPVGATVDPEAGEAEIADRFRNPVLDLRPVFVQIRGEVDRAGNAVGDFVQADGVLEMQPQMEKPRLERQFAAAPQAALRAEVVEGLVIVVIHRRQPRRPGVGGGDVGFPRQLLRGFPQPRGAERLTFG